MWEIRATHEGLHTYRVIRGVTKEEAELKFRLQTETWNARWSRLQEAEASRLARLNKRELFVRQADVDRRGKEYALELTKEAEASILAARSLLSSSWGKNHSLDWAALNDASHFTKSEPSPVALQTLPTEPLRTDDPFRATPIVPGITFLDRIVPRLKNKKLAAAQELEKKLRSQAEARFIRAHHEWKKSFDEASALNQNSRADYEKAKAAWVLEKHVFAEQQMQYNSALAEFRKQYLNRVAEAIVRYCNEVVARSVYPDTFPKDCQFSYDIETGMLALDYELPPQNAVPDIKQVKYVANRTEFQKTQISGTEFRRLYDDVLYQVCLRTLYELFRSDEIDAVKSIVFNGWVHAIDKATGADTHPCVMTIQVTKAEFLALNLNQVDLKACFRSLKGISGSRLADFSPVRPVLTLNREDPRFVGSYNVAESLSDKTNLAAMDWLDFENLIRELFEKEFSKNGGEVKITQASRDGGVDAIAFDPDPIRGGKIVIQAKRYTNTVGVAAVRDLFGTVHNEGATKGILVTTSDYGPDAYEFASGKPLTLLSGSELLFLLSKHGYHAKIDIKEAKKLLGEI
ncbi:MAG TPA: restriction endonuclease [Candidatus Acidoferrales bacterium]